MKIDRLIQQNGDPDFKIGFFSVWIHSRPYFGSTSNDFDKDWLEAVLLYESQVISFSDSGTFLTLSGLKRFLAECENLYGTLTGSAELSSYEPNVKILLNARSSGHIDAIYEFEPNMQTRIKCEEELDQTYLKQVVSDLNKTIHRNDLVNA